MALTRQINWDEFYFLSRIHEHLEDRLGATLQTFHVHLFAWVARLPGTAADQIVAGRLAMLALEGLTLWMIFLISRRFVSQGAAAFAVLAYASAGFVIVHGASFRFDPIATALLMLALWLLIAGPPSRIRAAGAGIAVAVAALVTIKSVFYLPVLAAACVWSFRTAEHRSGNIGALTVGVLTTVLGFNGLYFLHSRGIVVPGVQGAAETAAASAERVFDATSLLETGSYLAFSVLGSIPTWIAIGSGIVVLTAALLSGRRPPDAEDRLRAATLLAFAFPVATLVFYRNSFPYYHVFVLAPAAVLAGVAAERLDWLRFRLRRAIALMAVLVGLHVLGNTIPDQRAQRAALAAVHDVFPEPVPYIDRCSMVSSFRKVGFFMSAWGIESYRETGEPILRDAILREAPRFVLANGRALEEALRPGTRRIRPGHRLLPADAAALRQNYIHHWGPIWVAGKKLVRGEPGSATVFEIAVDGPYTLESAAPVQIDGYLLVPGGVIVLEPGVHEAVLLGTARTVTLRWGRHLPRPDREPPDGPLFQGF